MNYRLHIFKIEHYLGSQQQVVNVKYHFEFYNTEGMTVINGTLDSSGKLYIFLNVNDMLIKDMIHFGSLLELQATKLNINLDRSKEVDK